MKRTVASESGATHRRGDRARQDPQLTLCAIAIPADAGAGPPSLSCVPTRARSCARATRRTIAPALAITVTRPQPVGARPVPPPGTPTPKPTAGNRRRRPPPRARRHGAPRPPRRRRPRRPRRRRRQRATHPRRCPGPPTRPPPDPGAAAPALDTTLGHRARRALEFLYTGPDADPDGRQPGAIDDRRVGVVTGAVRNRMGGPDRRRARDRARPPRAGPDRHPRRRRVHDSRSTAAARSPSLRARRATSRRSARCGSTGTARPRSTTSCSCPYAARRRRRRPRRRRDERRRGPTVTDASGTRRARAPVPARTRATMTLPDGRARRRSTTMHRRALDRVHRSGHGPRRRCPASCRRSRGYTYAAELSIDEARRGRRDGRRASTSRSSTTSTTSSASRPARPSRPATTTATRGEWMAGTNGRRGQGPRRAPAASPPRHRRRRRRRRGRARGAGDHRRRARSSWPSCTRPGTSLWRVAINALHAVGLQLALRPAAPTRAPRPAAAQQRRRTTTRTSASRAGRSSAARPRRSARRSRVAGTPHGAALLEQARARPRLRCAGCRSRSPARACPRAWRAWPQGRGRGPGHRTLVHARPRPRGGLPLGRQGRVRPPGQRRGHRPRSRSPTATAPSTSRRDPRRGRRRRASRARPTSSQLRPLLRDPDHGRPGPRADRDPAGARGHAGVRDTGDVALGGWTLERSPRVRPGSRTLLRGDGSRERSEATRIVDRRARRHRHRGRQRRRRQRRHGHARRSRGLAVSAAGEVFIADEERDRVRRVGAGGTIDRFAGTGVYGIDGRRRPGHGARLASPRGMDVAPDGSVYIADAGPTASAASHRTAPSPRSPAAGHRPTASATALPATEAALEEPVDVAVGARRQRLHRRPVGYRVRHVTPDGVIATLVGTGEPGGVGDGGRRRGPHHPQRGRGAKDGGVLIADAQRARVRRVGLDGRITTFAGSGTPADGVGDNGPATAARLQSPRARRRPRRLRVHRRHDRRAHPAGPQRRHHPDAHRRRHAHADGRPARRRRAADQPAGRGRRRRRDDHLHRDRALAGRHDAAAAADGFQAGDQLIADRDGGSVSSSTRRAGTCARSTR